MKFVRLSRKLNSSPKKYSRCKSAAAILGAFLICAASAGAKQLPGHNVSAANINVVQNDTGNTTNSVSVTNTLRINDLRIRDGSNRGDYNLQVGDTPGDDLTSGLVMTAVAENGRDNNEGTGTNYMASAFDGTPNFGTNEFSSGYWVVMQDCTTARGEYNANCSAAFFRYTNWLCGWARKATAINGGTNDLFTGSPGLVLGTHFRGLGSGRSMVDLRQLGVYNTNGLLIVNHAKNEGNFGLSQANADGTWNLFVKDNNGDNASYEQDPIAFVYVSRTNRTVVSGRFGTDDSGTNTVVLMYSGDEPAFSITNLEVGRFRLTIPRYSPAYGVLIVSAEGGMPINRDNVVSYQPDGDGWIIESRDIIASQNYPVLETPTNEPVASFVFIPSATPGFTVTPTNGLATTESGGTASFTVVLDFPPTDDVTIGVSSSNTSEGTVSPASLTFTTKNWNVPQTVTITGQDDAVIDGPVSYSVILAPATSTDPAYNGFDPDDVAVVNADNDQAGVTVTPTSGLTTTEAGGSATFTIRLNARPNADVTIGLSSSNPGEGVPSPASVTFSANNWNSNQVVSVTGVDDAQADGDVAYTIITAPAVSADANYNGFDAPDVAAVNIDNDSVAVVLNAGTNRQISVVEGSTTNFSYVLGSQPAADVTISVVSSNPARGSVSPATLTFKPANWNVPQSVTLTGVDNFIVDGNATYVIASSVSSSDPAYAALTIPNILATTIDNEAALTLPSGDCIYGLGMPAIGIDGRATLADFDTLNYNGGSLSFALTNNANADDRLEIRNTGAGAGEIGVSGSSVTFEGGAIGTFSGGNGATPLVITLNTNGTVAAVQELLRSITFRTATNVASLATRSLLASLNDGLGGTSQAAKFIRVGMLRQTQYQEGANYGYGIYSGAGDIALSEAGANTPWPVGRNPVEGLLVDWPDIGTPDTSQVLLRFDNLIGTNTPQIPSNAVIVSAELLVNVNNSGNGGTLNRMLIPWDSSTATWNSMGAGIQQDDVESVANYESQWNVQAGTGLTGAGIVSIGVTPDVQVWANGTNNYGWVITGWPFNTDGTAFSPSEAANINLRPRLRVLWLPAEESIVSFRQNVDNYTSAFDTRIRANAPDVNFSTVASVFVDYAVSGTSDQEQVLLRFDNLIGTTGNQIPPGVRVDAAMLDLSSFVGNATGDGGHLHRLLQPWDDTVATWNSWGGDGIQADDVEAASAVTATAGNPNLDPNVQGGFNSFEVTADVQAWANGTINYGWVWLPWTGGGDGWGFGTAEAANERDRPRLRVFISAGAANIDAAVIQPLTVGPSQVQVNFTGTAGRSYSIWRASNPNGPWSTIGTATVAPDGHGTFTDAMPLPSAGFYRVVYP